MSESKSNVDGKTARSSGAANPLKTLIRLAMLSAFVGNGLAAAVWWMMMPGGFAPSHTRFWLNCVWPVVLLAVCLGGICSGLLRRDAVGKWCLVFLACTAILATVTARVVFPDIIGAVLVVGAVIGGVEAITAALAEPRRVQLSSVAITIAAAIPFGWFMPWGLQPERPTTTPLNEACPWEPTIVTNKSAGELPGYVQVSDRVGYMPFADETFLRLGQMRIFVRPLLTFESASASGAPTVLARGKNVFPMTRLIGTETDEAGTISFFGPHDRLRISDRERTTARRPIEIVSYTTLPEPIYSHLNHYCTLNISGYKSLELEFSPCGATRFTPKEADYPVGRPARFAYCDDDRTFRVVEATSGEKGPFKTLGEGRLESGEPLMLGLFDEGKRVADLHFYDWSWQLSTSPSPTAGGGVAANAIEFQAAEDSHGSSSVTIWFSLAATSVGRGWDTVGHAAGTYRNRIVIHPVPVVEK